MGVRTCLACWMLALLLPVAAAAPPDLVLVDPSRGFATIYVSVPADLPAQVRQELEVLVAEHEGAYLEPWQSFVCDVRKHVTVNIRRNDYPEIDSAESLVLLLREFELQEIGLTWNGGLAIRPQDYAFAEGTYQGHAQDPAFVARPWDRASDPVHPWNFTGPLLNRRPGAGSRS